MFRIRASSNMAAAVLLVLVICVVVTLLSNRHYTKWDLTSTKEHTLSDKTLQVLGTIQEPVEMKAFVQEGQGGAREVRKLLAAYHDNSPRITFELIDPDRQPALANRYQVKTLNTVIMEGYGGTQTITIPDEGSITNGLIRLSRKEVRKVYFLTGHGERTLDGSEPESLSSLQTALKRENLEFEELNLMKADVPADAALVMIAAPNKPLFPEEVQSLASYLGRGGSVILFLEPYLDGGMDSFLLENGILISQDMVVDKMSRIMGGDYLMPMIANYAQHEITKDFQLTCFFPSARSVEAAKEKTPRTGLNTTSLAFTSEGSWAETDRATLNQGRAGFDGRDRQGPISLAVISEIRQTPRMGAGMEGDKQKAGTAIGPGRLVVFGDVDFASNKFLNLSGNGEFIHNTVNFLVGRQDLITIQRERKQVQALMFSRNQGQLLFWVPVVLIPVLILVLGILVWNKRRSR
ncbi:MAG: hypothetical protein CVU57_18260 [Deltaproteobacteria bacterium HGW-Deltaproteobacteria-15]|jgi:ABC-type uncharacterized transport system involved in gliding motility auxiliary subunit|nr:MAG: hypothetical protein CVU57_18260 [Deltaproteobacteria bacterium HGW-Deltaproteobacteria-15]